MPYHFAQERLDYSAFASGQVLHSFPGRTAFPVRAASEVLQRCASLLAAAGRPGPYTLYDPCCGGAQLLTTLAFLHGQNLAHLIGSDIDPDAVQLAERNLALLTPTGVAARAATLADLHARHGKDSHAQALAHARALELRLPALAALTTRTFVADATSPPALRAHLAPDTLDIVFADIPHGHQTAWQTTAAHPNPATPTTALLDALLPLLAPTAIVAIAANRQQRSAHPAYRRAHHWQLGKRHITFLTPSPSTQTRQTA